MKKFTEFIVDFLLFFFTFLISDWFTYTVLKTEKWYIHLAVYLVVYPLGRLTISLIEKIIANLKKK